MSKKDKVKIEQVINFLTENEQYGDDWKEHIKVLENLLEVWDDVHRMNKDELIEWILNLPLQTLTDELKDDIIEKIDDL